MINVTMRIRVFVIVSAVILQACASISPRNPVPEEFAGEVAIPGAPYGRMWGDGRPADWEARVQLMQGQLLLAEDRDVQKESISVLTISGGGADGAFGAGLLKGWSESGDRPTFWVVTGISTGALTAPFAFLGPDYDDELERLYTSFSTSDLVVRRGLLTSLTGDALTDTTPIRELMKEIVDHQMIDLIAKQHNLGRRLLIGTTNLDTGRPVIWNIGEIAQNGSDDSRQLIRDVLLASASIPGVFPPVRIQVSVGDETYDELHVDGGTSSQVFLYPAAINLRTATERLGMTGRLTVYVIRNGSLAASWAEVEPKLGPIVRRSLEVVIRAQGVGDLYRIYLGAKRDGIQYRLAYIPDDFNHEPEEMFDSDYMRALFERAHNMARDGYPWHESPPGVALP